MSSVVRHVLGAFMTNDFPEEEEGRWMRNITSYRDELLACLHDEII